MFTITQKNTTILLFFFFILIATSMACIGATLNDSKFRAFFGDPYDLTDEKEAEYQIYLGSSQTELISVESFPDHENCPPDDVDLSPNGVVNYEISGDTLTVSDEMGSMEYNFTSHVIDQFCRGAPDGLTECISFQTINGSRVSNLRRYIYDGAKIDPYTLCYDQNNKLNAGIDDLSETEVDLTLVELTFEECNANNDFSLVVGKAEFSETGDTCKFTIKTTNKSAENGIVLSYYHAHVDENNSNKEWNQWYFKPGDELEWPLLGTYSTYTDGTSYRAIMYWEKASVYYSIPGCEWIGWDDSNYEIIATKVPEPPCPMP